MIFQDGFFLPSEAPINGGFIQVQEDYSNPNPNPNSDVSTRDNKRKRNQPGKPDPEAEVVALSPKSLMATNRFICEVCNKGFQREQNLQLHRRGHNLPWKLKQKTNKDEPVKKKVYICPEKSCVHHDPSRALGDLTGVKKHYSRKHGEKRWKCDKCSKKYAVMSDWKAHSKICGTREYKCDCGTTFSRKDSFITHRAFCDALMEERMKVTTTFTPSSLSRNSGNGLSTNGSFMAYHHPINPSTNPSFSTSRRSDFLSFEASPSKNGNNNMIIDSLNQPRSLPMWLDHQAMNISSSYGGPGHALSDFSPANLNLFACSSSPSLIPQGATTLPKEEEEIRANYDPQSFTSLYSFPPSSTGNVSATTLLQQAAQMGSINFASLNDTDHLHQKQSIEQQMNDQLTSFRGFSNPNGQPSMMGGNHGYNNKDDKGAGVRDFLGAL